MLGCVLTLLAAVALMAAVMLVMAMPAFAEAKSPEVNCVGELASHAEPGTKGQVGSQGAIGSKGVGELLKSLARGEVPCSL